jgi:hypothetical protein
MQGLQYPYRRWKPQSEQNACKLSSVGERMVIGEKDASVPLCNTSPSFIVEAMSPFVSFTQLDIRGPAELADA